MLTWVRGYQRSWLRWDLLAGVTVTAYLVPQVMANATLAGLPAEVGLWAAVGALLGYALFGTSRVVSLGPESTAALITATALATTPAAERPEFAAALALATALICLLAWLARLDAVADLLSKPVLEGYLVGIAAVMIASQLGDLLGTDVDGSEFGVKVWNAVRSVPDTDPTTVTVGLITLAAMLVAAHFLPRAPIALMGMLGATAAVAALGLDVARVGDIPVGVPIPAIPGLDPGEFARLLVPALGVAFVAYTDTILTGRAFATGDERTDPRRELLALGAANLGAGLMQGFPASSSGSRTALALSVGAKSQLAGVATAVMTVFAVLLARPLLEAFPQAALGAVVVYAALKLVDVRELRRFARFRSSEAILAVATTVSVLAFGVLYGVLAAIGLSVLDLLRRVARPHDAVQGFVDGIAGMHDMDDFDDARSLPGLVVYRYDSPLFFANAEDFRTRALAAIAAQDHPVEWFVLNTEAISEIDITSVDVLDALHEELTGRGIVLALARLKQDLRDSLAPTGLLDRIGHDRIFYTLPTAVEAFTSR